MGEKVHVNVFHEAVGDCAAACAEGVSPFVNGDKFSIIKDSFNDDNTEILLSLLNYHYDFCHIGYIILLSDWKMSKSTKIALTRFADYSDDIRLRKLQFRFVRV